MIVRSVGNLVLDALQDTPVVLIQGPRQVGKSTLAQEIARQRFDGNYVTLDDPMALASVVENPAGFLRSHKPPLVLDEVQRCPALMLAIKLLIDQDRKPGSFLLTGSANVLALPKVADSLAGRIEVVDLLPFSAAELAGGSRNFADAAFEEEGAGDLYPDIGDLPKRLAVGGFPEVVARASAQRRDAWFQSYVRTVLDRDVRDLANISALTQMPRLLALLAARSGSSLNLAGLSVDTGIPHTSLTRYVDLLKALMLVALVPAWSSVDGGRTAKAPKAHIVDTGLMTWLRGAGEGALAHDPLSFEAALRSFVASELLKLAQTSKRRPTVYHLRTMKRKEVDFVLEDRSGAVIGIEVCAAQAVTPHTVEGLHYLAELAEGRFARGVVLYPGAKPQRVGENMIALPISALWA